MTPEQHHLAHCAVLICEREAAQNPIPWFDLEQAGVTREVLQDMVDKGQWLGPRPLFEMAPDRDGGMWKYMLENRPEPSGDAG